MNCKTNRNGWRRAAAGLLAGICLLTSTGATALAANAAPGSDPAAADAVTAAATPETATPETALGPEAQAFIDAVNALDRESILAAVRQWATASTAWQADPDNADLEAALNEAIAASDAASAPVYAAEDLYYAIPEEEQQGEEVQAAYTALAALIASMQLAMEQPELPEDTGAPPDDDEIYDVLYGDLPDKPTGNYLGRYGLPVATGDTKMTASKSTAKAVSGTGKAGTLAANRRWIICSMWKGVPLWKRCACSVTSSRYLHRRITPMWSVNVRRSSRPKNPQPARGWNPTCAAGASHRP